MKAPGILWMLQTAVGFSMAGPMFVVGIEFLRSGRIVGGIGFLALGAVALYFPTYVVNRISGPRTWIRRRLGRNDGTESEPDVDADSDAEATGRLPGPLERLRRR